MKICQITGKIAQVGNKVSHSNRKSKRRFDVNLHTKRFFDAETNDWVTLKVSAHGIRIINKKGFSACLKESRAKGLIS